MQHFRGFKHFDFIPQTFLLPSDYKELVCAHNKNKGELESPSENVLRGFKRFLHEGPWIVKPAASSRGRGIYLAKTPEEIQSHTNDEQVRSIEFQLKLFHQNYSHLGGCVSVYNEPTVHRRA